jgi:hypothetical protein
MRMSIVLLLCPFVLAACSGGDAEKKAAAAKPTVTVAPRESAKPPPPPPAAPVLDASGKASFPATEGKGLPTGVGVKDGAVIKSTGKAGHAQYGPYVTLPAGDYKVVWIGRVESAKVKPAGKVDVASDIGRKIHAAQPVEVTGKDAKTIAELDFSLPAQTPNIEFRFAVADGTMATLERVELSRK